MLYITTLRISNVFCSVLSFYLNWKAYLVFWMSFYNFLSIHLEHQLFLYFHYLRKLFHLMVLKHLTYFSTYIQKTFFSRLFAAFWLVCSAQADLTSQSDVSNRTSLVSLISCTVDVSFFFITTICRETADKFRVENNFTLTIENVKKFIKFCSESLLDIFPLPRDMFLACFQLSWIFFKSMTREFTTGTTKKLFASSHFPSTVKLMSFARLATGWFL